MHCQRPPPVFSAVCPPVGMVTISLLLCSRRTVDLPPLPPDKTQTYSTRWTLRHRSERHASRSGWVSVGLPAVRTLPGVQLDPPEVVYQAALLLNQMFNLTNRSKAESVRDAGRYRQWNQLSGWVCDYVAVSTHGIGVLWGLGVRSNDHAGELPQHLLDLVSCGFGVLFKVLT